MWLGILLLVALLAAPAGAQTQTPTYTPPNTPGPTMTPPALHVWRQVQGTLMGVGATDTVYPPATTPNCDKSHVSRAWIPNDATYEVGNMLVRFDTSVLAGRTVDAANLMLWPTFDNYPWSSRRLSGDWITGWDGVSCDTSRWTQDEKTGALSALSNCGVACLYPNLVPGALMPLALDDAPAHVNLGGATEIRLTTGDTVDPSVRLDCSSLTSACGGITGPTQAYLSVIVDAPPGCVVLHAGNPFSAVGIDNVAINDSATSWPLTDLASWQTLIDTLAGGRVCSGDWSTACAVDGDCAVPGGVCSSWATTYYANYLATPGDPSTACLPLPTETPTETPTVTPTAATSTPTGTPTVTPTTTPACGTPPYVITTTTDSTAAGSLRWAVGCCNGDTLNVPAGTYTLALGELPIQRPCTINGAGMSATLVDANNASRVFNIGNFSGDVTVRDLTVENGNVGADCGGGIELGTCNGFMTTSANLLVQRARFNGNSASVGGGIDDNSSGTLTVSDTVCDHNTATLLPNGDGACVFGEYNNGAITLSGMTITDNSGATSSVSVFAPNTGSATLALTNTTFGGNTTPYDIDIGGNSTATVVNVSAVAIRGSASLPTHSVTQVANSIVRSCTLLGGAASITSLGHNIDTGSTCGFTAPGDQQNTDPLLNALASNGGPTQTMSLQGGSPAINGGDDAICAAGPVSGLDQRGYVRPGAGQAHCSIGAYENAGVPGGITPGRKHGFSGGAVINVQ